MVYFVFGHPVMIIIISKKTLYSLMLYRAKEGKKGEVLLIFRVTSYDAYEIPREYYN